MPPANLRANRITALYSTAIKHLLALPLPAKCAVIVMLVLVVQSATLLLASARGNQQLIQQQSTLFAQQWVKQIAYLSREGLIRNDNVTLLSILRQQAENPLLGYARISDSDDKTLVEVGLHEQDNLRFVSPIMIGQDIAGNVILELQTAPLQSAQQQLQWQLLLLAAVMMALAVALMVALGQKVDNLLVRVRHSLLHPSEAPLNVSYPGADSFGDVLETLATPEPLVPGFSLQSADWVVLHMHWQHFDRLTQQWGKAELDRRLTQSYQAALAMARLYHGQLKIHRRDGVTLRFRALEGSDPPLLRALCSAHLLSALDQPLGACAAIGSVRGESNQFQLEAQEVKLVDALAACQGRAIQTRLPGDLSSAALEWADATDNGLVMKARYLQLLDKQRARLEAQLAGG